MQQYLRTDADGNQVLDITLLDEDARLRFLEDVQRWAETIPVPPGDPAASEDQRYIYIHSAVAAALDEFPFNDDGVRITRKTEVWMYDVIWAVLEEKYPV